MQCCQQSSITCSVANKAALLAVLPTKQYYMQCCQQSCITCSVANEAVLHAVLPTKQFYMQCCQQSSSYCIHCCQQSCITCSVANEAVFNALLPDKLHYLQSCQRRPLFAMNPTKGCSGIAVQAETALVWDIVDCLDHGCLTPDFMGLELLCHVCRYLASGIHTRAIVKRFLH